MDQLCINNIESGARLPEISVTLVHGTFARNAKWTKPGSKLRSHIESECKHPVTFSIFPWSGLLSFGTRRRAASRLSKQLIQQHAERPERPQFIVAHSHGGNIAVDAMQDPSVQRCVAGVITLSTPFLIGRPRIPTPTTRWLLREIFPALNVLLATAPFIAIVYYRLKHLYLAEEFGTVGTIAEKLTVPFFVLSLFLGFVLSCVLTILTIKLPKLAARAFPACDAQGIKLHILRTRADEASILLTACLGLSKLFSSIVERHTLLDRFFNDKQSNATTTTIETESLDAEGPEGYFIVGRLFWAAVLVTLWTLAVIGIARRSFKEEPFEVLWIVALTGFVVVALPATVICTLFLVRSIVATIVASVFIGLVVVPFSLLFSILLFPIGPELVIFAFFVDVTPEVAPPGNWMIYQFPNNPKDDQELYARGLLHSVCYEHPEALDKIVDLIKNDDSSPESFQN